MIVTLDQDTETVLVDGALLDPAPSLLVFNHSPDGFSWGYEGSGPAQLALAILLHAGTPARIAVSLHQRFKREFVAQWSHSGHGETEVEVDVRGWVSEATRDLT